MSSGGKDPSDESAGGSSVFAFSVDAVFAAASSVVEASSDGVLSSLSTTVSSVAGACSSPA